MRNKLIVMILGAVAALMPVSPALAAVNIQGTNPSLLGTYSVAGYHSDLDGGSYCHDSNNSVPIYLVDSLNDGSGADGAGHEYETGTQSNCTAWVEVDRQKYANSSSGGKAYIRAHELDHARGFSHGEGFRPNGNGTRTTGENASFDSFIPCGLNSCRTPIY